VSAAEPNPQPDPRRTIRKLNLIGLAITIVLIGGVGGWATTAQLAGAVIAPGTIVVESNVKKVQHPTGGIVGEILVKEGGEVEAGQVVLRLDDTVTKATLGVVRSQLDELMAREARLFAERDDAAAIAFPAQLTGARDDASAATATAGEEKLFESRRTARTGQRAQLRERVAQLNEEIRGLSAQLAAKESELDLIGKELVGVAELYQKKLVSISRYTQLQRDQTRLQGESGQFIAQIARARGKISETELQIIQLDQDFRTDVLKDLREAQGKIAELKERVTAAEDQLKRVDLRAPQAGTVHQLAVYTVDGVIGKGETLMQIVPRADELVVEAKVAPPDIDQVAVGAKAMVRIMAGNQRTQPEVMGLLTRVSADLTREQQQPNSPQPPQAYYTVRIALPPEEVARLKDIRLVPGMPADAFIPDPRSHPA
jgi:HlyD family secretion protein